MSSGVAAVSLAVDHACSLMTSGAVKCWGLNNVGQLGSPQGGDVPGLPSDVTAVSAGDGYTCILTSRGAVQCWGAEDNNLPHNPGLSAGVTQIATGVSNMCALMSNGTVKCWGNTYLTSGSQRSPVPTDIALCVNPDDGSSRVGDISVGLTASCALTGGGTVYCWGGNHWGQLGNGLTTDNGVPGEVSGL